MSSPSDPRDLAAPAGSLAPLGWRMLTPESETHPNPARNRELRPTFNGEYAVLLHTGAKLTLSRGYPDALRARLGADW